VALVPARAGWLAGIDALMRVSAKADYAIRAVVELAVDTGQPLTCEVVAASQGIPYPFLKAVFRDLRTAGLVCSQRGCEGGYRLGRDPGAITLADVVAAVDGGLMSVRGESPDALEYPAPGHRIADVWRAMRARTEAILTGMTVADLLVDPPAGQ
jgi:Rrf2 family protein